MDYPYIRAWGDLMGSTQQFVDGEVERAKKDGAPEDAVYRESSVNKKWRTADGLPNAHVKNALYSKAKMYGVLE